MLIREIIQSIMPNVEELFLKNYQYERYFVFYSNDNVLALKPVFH